MPSAAWWMPTVGSRSEPTTPAILISPGTGSVTSLPSRPVTARHRGSAARDVIERDQVVRLAAAEGRLQANDRVLPDRVARQATEGILQKGLQTSRGIGVLEEGLWIAINRVSFVIHDIPEPGGKDVFLQLTAEDLIPGVGRFRRWSSMTSPVGVGMRENGLVSRPPILPQSG